MDFLTHILLDYGYWGMFLSALLAGSVLPFSSEVVLVGLIASGLDPVLLLIYGTTGNVLGGLINYGLGRMVTTLLPCESEVTRSCPTVHGGPRLMDGILCFSAHHR